MATISDIEWTEATWNPLTGCVKISTGCKHCYAETLSKRLQKMGVENYRNGFNLAMHNHTLDIPLKWKKPKVIFVNSMSDLFQKGVPISFIKKVFKTMKKAHWHHFQVLTKRSERLASISSKLEWSDNIWMGVSVENKDHQYRISDLLSTKAKIKFLSLEPLLGPLPRIRLKGIDWVIVGGESGFKARTMDSEWVVQIKNQCLQKNVPFFFKQWGGRKKHLTGRTLEGRTWNEMPSKYYDQNNTYLDT